MNLETQEYRIIQLTQNKVTIIDNDDYERVSKYNWCAHKEGRGYFYAKNSRFRLHRFILGANDPNIFVDHINGNTLDNRKCNLRLATRSENNRNVVSKRRKYKGVQSVNRKKNPYRAHIRVNYKYISLGSFKTAEEAALAYNKAAIVYFGDFARLNIIKSTHINDV